MVDEQAKPGEQPEDDEPEFEAPTRGSADELLDAGAHAPIDAMRHSTAHVMAEAVLDLFPGAKLGIGPAIDNGFYYDFELPRPLTPDDLAAIEARMGKSVKADHPFVRKELPFDEARAIVESEGQGFKVEILDDLRAKAEAAGEPAPVTTFYEHGPFRDLCRGPHVESTGKIGPFKLLAVSGAYWRGRPGARVDAAHLRHGLGDAGGARPVPVAARGGQEARPPPPRRAARPVQLPRRRARFRVLAPQGLAPVPDAARRDARAPGAPRLRGDLHAAARPPEAVGAVRPLGALPRQHVPRRRRGAVVQPQADELPRVVVHLPITTPLVPRPAAAPVRVRRAAPQRAVGRAVGAHAGPPLRHRRCPHLRPAGPDRLRDRGADGRDPRGVRLVRPRRRRSRSARGPTRPWATPPCGPRPRRSCGRSSTGPASSTGSRRRTARSTRPSSTSRSRMRSAASGRRRRSRSTA